MSHADYTPGLLLELRVAGFPEPKPEFAFHPRRKWRFDLAWPEKRMAVEIEGGIWTDGRHTRGSGYEGDCEKYNEAAILNWLVIRVTPGMINDGRAMEFISRAYWRSA